MGRSTAIEAPTRLHLAMSALDGIKDEAAVPHLVGWLNSPIPDTRIRGVGALMKFPGKRAESAIIGAAKDDVAAVRAAAVRALGAFRSREALHAVLEAQSGQTPQVRGAAAAALGGAVGLVDTNAAIHALATAAEDQDESVQTTAAEGLGSALGKAEADAASALLLRLMDHSSATVRVTAAHALGRLGEKRAIPKLKAHIQDDRIGFAEALMKLGEPFDPTWVTPVIRGKKGNAWQNTIWMVRRNGGKWAAPALIGCLDFDDSKAGYYNYTLCWQIAACGGPHVKYHHDFDSNGTPEQIRHNAEVLKQLKSWMQDFYRRNPRRPTTQPAKCS